MNLSRCRVIYFFLIYRIRLAIRCQSVNFGKIAAIIIETECVEAIDGSALIRFFAENKLLCCRLFVLLLNYGVLICSWYTETKR